MLRRQVSSNRHLSLTHYHSIFYSTHVILLRTPYTYFSSCFTIWHLTTSITICNINKIIYFMNNFIYLKKLACFSKLIDRIKSPILLIYNYCLYSHILNAIWLIAKWQSYYKYVNVWTYPCMYEYRYVSSCVEAYIRNACFLCIKRLRRSTIASTFYKQF